MSETIRFSLPKVQLRTKTSILDTIQTTQYEGNQTPFKEHPPPVFQQRIKMKKQIQESYIRFRRHKKNNYIKQYSSSKRSHSDKRVSTIDLRIKTKNPEDKIDLRLQSDQNEKQLILHKYSKRQNSFQLIQRQKQSDISSRRDLLVGTCKSSQAKNEIMGRNNSLYDTEIAKQIKKNLQLKGKHWNRSHLNQSKKIYNHIVKINNQKIKNKIVGGKSTSFRIQAWKSDRLSEAKLYLECQEFQLEF